MEFNRSSFCNNICSVHTSYYTQLAFAFNSPGLPADILKMFDYQEAGSWMFVGICWAMGS
ncbi:MAG: hypothetical protein GPJ52_14805 [Candidatus Heimdallarchaeota archaeon]|nr:hypothetical protein [Candidatus Heimdallarchaeota archaeon]